MNTLYVAPECARVAHGTAVEIITKDTACKFYHFENFRKW